MSKLSDQEFLLTDQYRDASNLDARIQLHRRFSVNKYGWIRWVFDRLDLPPMCRILDLGCGPANLWAENLQRIPAGWDITLTDFSPGMLEKAQENLGESERPFSFDTVDAQDIPHDDASFDTVICTVSVEYLAEPVEVFREVSRVLKQDGRFIVTFSNRWFPPKVTRLWTEKPVLWFHDRRMRSRSSERSPSSFRNARTLARKTRSAVSVSTQAIGTQLPSASQPPRGTMA